MSIIRKIFDEESIGSITNDTKLSMMDIVKFVKEDKQNIAKVHEAATNGNLDCQLFISHVSFQSLQRHESNPFIDDETLTQTHKNLEQYTRLAAEQGDIDSQYNLAKYYLTMVDMSKGHIDEEEASILKEARRWYKKAHANGHSDLSEIISSLEFVQ